MYNGKMISVDEFVKKVFSKVTGLVGSAEKLRKEWSVQETRRELLAKLAENGFEMERLKELQKMMLRKTATFSMCLSMSRSRFQCRNALNVQKRRCWA